MVYDKPGISRNNKPLPIQGEFYSPGHIHKIVDMLNGGRAPVVGIFGKQGWGKSIAAMRLIDVLYQHNLFKGEWTADYLVYDALPFLKQLKSIPPVKDGEDINPDRQLFVFDEGAVKMSSKEWWTQENKWVDKTLQTQRYRNCMYIFVTPFKHDLAKPIIQNLDIEITMKAEGVAKVSGWYRMHDRETEKKSRVWLNYGMWGKQKPRGEDKKIPMPSDDILNQYRPKEHEAKDNILDEGIEMLEEKKKEEEGKQDWELY